MQYSDNLKSNNDMQEIDIIISRNCNLRCKYCYVHKHKEKEFSIEKIMISLDRALSILREENNVKNQNRQPLISIYPETWLNLERTNEVIKESLKVLLNYPEFLDGYLFTLGTNGVRMNETIPILEHLTNFGVAVTIDGVKESHDLYRVFADGRGSWDIVKKNILDYQERYNIYSTKVTIGPETIKYMYDDMIFLFDEMNFTDVNMNVPFEDIWGSVEEKQKSLIEYEKQLDKITNYVIKNELWLKGKYISVVGARQIPQNDNRFENRTYCGAAVMRSIDTNGDVFPCIRFVPFNLERKIEDKTWKIYDSDIKKETSKSLRSLKLLNLIDSLPQDCIKCPLLDSCPTCVGGSYDETGSIFSRLTHHCEFQKLQYKYAKKIQDTIDKGE